MDGLPFLRSRAVAVGAMVLSVVAGVVALLMVLLGQAIQCFDGDGGSPYVAHDSPMGGACRFGAGVPLFSVPLAALAAGIVVASVIVQRWWRVELRARWLLLALMLPAAVPITTFLAVQWAVPAECIGDDAAAYDAWLASGADTPAPADCDSY